MKLSSPEKAAMEQLKRHGGCVSTCLIDDCSVTDILGEIIPGIKTFKKLEKKGLVFFTEEEPLDLDDGEMFELQSLIYLTEADQ